MKIFQVVPYYPPHIGGMEFYVQSLSEELASRGHDVTVFTSSNDAFSSIGEVKGVRVCSLKKMAKVYNVPIVPSLFLRLLDEEKPDVIHTHQYPVFFSDVSALVSSLRHIPLLLHVHVVSEPKSVLSGFVSNIYYSTFGLHTLKSANIVAVPSLAYKLKLQKMHVTSDKIKVIPLGIETKKFQIKNGGEDFKIRYNCQGSKIILSVGRLNYQKGFKYLIKAMQTVLKQIPNAKLVIVGEGEQLPYLYQLSKTLGLTNSVIFTGALLTSEMPNMYSAADVFVLPSLFESFGIALIEAQATGKPVIGTRVGGVPEALLEDKTGFLVKPGDPYELGVAIINVLSDESLAKKMGEEGKEFVESRFSIKTAVCSVTDAYTDLMLNTINKGTNKP